ncbi:hypothetical protein AB0H12_19830 [Actinosynnema sp. NPDC023794]
MGAESDQLASRRNAYVTVYGSALVTSALTRRSRSSRGLPSASVRKVEGSSNAANAVVTVLWPASVCGL